MQAQAQPKQNANLPEQCLSSKLTGLKIQLNSPFPMFHQRTTQPSPTSWQREDDTHLEHRKITLLAIIHILRQRKDISQARRKNVPQLAKRIEKSLYRKSNSLEEYIDDSTLRRRIKELAINAIKKCHSEKRDTPSIQN